MDDSIPSRRAVSQSAFVYLHEQLWLARGLEPYLKHVIDAANWQVWTIADVSVADTRLAQFARAGHVYSKDLSCGISYEVARVMSQEENSVWIVPDSMARPGHRFLADVTVEYVVVGDGVYYVETSADSDRVARVWRQAASAAGQMGVVTAAQRVLTAPTDDNLLAAADNAQLLVVTAYDGEGALFFQRLTQENLMEPEHATSKPEQVHWSSGHTHGQEVPDCRDPDGSRDLSGDNGELDLPRGSAMRS